MQSCARIQLHSKSLSRLVLSIISRNTDQIFIYFSFTFNANITAELLTRAYLFISIISRTEYSKI
jgi:hypothetical protein